VKSVIWVQPDVTRLVVKTMAAIVHDPAGAKTSKITLECRVYPHPLYGVNRLLSSVFLHHKIAMFSYFIVSRSHLPTHQSIKILLEALG
jgi:hypothetical protein